MFIHHHIIEVYVPAWNNIVFFVALQGHTLGSNSILAGMTFDIIML